MKMEDMPRYIEQLKQPWNSRNRVDKSVLGTIDLAFLRGYHAGYLDGKNKRRAKYYAGED